ncbi:hydroxyacylglutathione [Ecytonucleospora hepatopenaei]|uniref:Hydroxyacylglutathione n=1 Tax=Ecytonucleospora hepatopenaei TaxID=646526 RepID=A0A1W0E5R9_9MICR|nr:hydroxyacylglutathione [Ecytonucleospora hepatopenaei]
MLNFCAVLINKDNYAYVFYDKDICFFADSSEPEVLIALSDKNMENGKVYKKQDLKYLEKINPRKICGSFTTHWHLDHSGGDAILSEKYKIQIYDPSFFKTQNKPIYIGSYKIIAIHTPCHTKDSFCYNINDQYCLTGDFIFKLGCGHFFEGTANDFIKSFRKLDENTPNEILFLYGHDYYQQNMTFACTKTVYTKEEMKIAEENIFLTKRQEKKLNIFIKEKNSVKLQKLRNEKSKI